MKQLIIKELAALKHLIFIMSVGVAALHFMSSAVSAQSESNFVTSPTPPAAELSPPGPEVPNEIANWYGRWEGRWDGRWPLVVAVNGFEQRDGKWFARVQYYWKERRDEPYRLRQSVDNWVEVTPTEIEMARISIARSQPSDQLACANGAFPKPRSAALSWKSHSTNFEDSGAEDLNISEVCQNE